VAVAVLVKQVAMLELEALVVVALIAEPVLEALELLVKDLPEVVQLQVLANMPPQGAEALALLEVGHPGHKAEMVAQDSVQPLQDQEFSTLVVVVGMAILMPIQVLEVLVVLMEVLVTYYLLMQLPTQAAEVVVVGITARLALPDYGVLMAVLELSSFVGLHHNKHQLPQQEAFR
jgi:hypothetical protein